jgi:signal peptidase II
VYVLPSRSSLIRARPGVEMSVQNAEILRRWVRLRLTASVTTSAAREHGQDARRRRSPGARSYTLLGLGVAAAVMTVDAVTKALAVQLLAGRGTVHFGGVLALELYRNHVGARNAFQGHPALASILALGAVIAIAAGVTRARTSATAVAVGLLLGGGLGNLVDRILNAPGPLRGGVIDWLRTPWSAGSMNLADLAIECGVLVLFAAVGMSLLKDRWHAPQPGPVP